MKEPKLKLYYNLYKTIVYLFYILIINIVLRRDIKFVCYFSSNNI
jgi:hypothetical protein